MRKYPQDKIEESGKALKYKIYCKKSYKCMREILKILILNEEIFRDVKDKRKRQSSGNKKMPSIKKVKKRK